MITRAGIGRAVFGRYKSGAAAGQKAYAAKPQSKPPPRGESVRRRGSRRSGVASSLVNLTQQALMADVRRQQDVGELDEAEKEWTRRFGEFLPKTEGKPEPPELAKTYKFEFADNGPLQQAHPLNREKIPQLQHDLNRVLFSPGVHFVQDPRTGVLNFPEYLQKLVKYEDFDFDKLQGFVGALKDQKLLSEAQKANRQFYLSTSLMTALLIQFYFLLNNYQQTEEAQRVGFPDMSETALTLPASVIVEPKGANSDGGTIYSITADKSADTEILLGAMGLCMETYLTTTEEEFKAYLAPGKNRGDTGDTGAKPGDGVAASGSPAPPAPENVYNYSTYGDFLMRSQLDCHHESLPGNGTFDLKTRAVCAIRQDKSADPEKCDYVINRHDGHHESFQREFDDLIKTGAMLKYAFQARIGQMDGIYVAYHNLKRFFGFQYLPLSEIDRIFYRNKLVEEFSVEKCVEHAYELGFRKIRLPVGEQLPLVVADRQFRTSLDLWSEIMKQAASDLAELGYPRAPFRLVLKLHRTPPKTPGKEPKNILRAWAVPLDQETISTLDSFPKQFETLFRHKMPLKQKMKNLLLFRKGLNDLNKEIISDRPVLGYDVLCRHIFDRHASYEDHPYPRSPASKWLIQAMIRGLRGNIKEDPGVASKKAESLSKLRDGVRQLYLDLMKAVSSMVTSSFRVSEKIKKLRYFSKLGKLRSVNTSDLSTSDLNTSDLNPSDLNVSSEGQESEQASTTGTETYANLEPPKP